MPWRWIDVTQIPFYALLLLERIQLSWFPGWGLPEPNMSLALEANPLVTWYLRRKCPEISTWVDGELQRAVAEQANHAYTPEEIRQAEVSVLRSLADLLVYVLDPAIYDRLPFLGWDSIELTGLTDFRGARVLDIGAGTGRLSFAAAPLAQTVWAVEPVGNLRDYMRARAASLGLTNFYAVDGTITSIPFPDGFADITMEGHVFGDFPETEHAEMMRVTRPGGMVIHCPGNNDEDNDIHRFLVEQGYQCSVFVEPHEDCKRKYWLTKKLSVVI